jgi:hypothetical protein
MSRSMGGILRRGVGSVESVSLRVGVVYGRPSGAGEKEAEPKERPMARCSCEGGRGLGYGDWMVGVPPVWEERT